MRYLFSLLFAIGCASQPQVLDQPAQPAKPKTPTYLIMQDGEMRYTEDPEEAARDLLKTAAESRADCAKLVVYGQVIDEFPKTKSAKFAKRAYAPIEADVLATMNRLSKHFKSMSETELSNILETINGISEKCPKGKIIDLMEKQLATVRAIREKKYGY